MTKQKLLANQAQCKICKQVIQSKHRHDFVSCKCGEISVDGGVDYVRRLARDLDSIIDLSIYGEVSIEIKRKDNYANKERKKVS